MPSANPWDCPWPKPCTDTRTAASLAATLKLHRRLSVSLPFLHPEHERPFCTTVSPDTSATAASLAATLKLHRHLSAGGNGSNGNGNGKAAAEAELFEDMDDIGLKPATVYHNLR